MIIKELLFYFILCPIVFSVIAIGFIKLFDYIADSDIWIKREDRDQ